MRVGYLILKKVKQLLRIAYKYKDANDRSQVLEAENVEPLDSHEQELWDVWARWRKLGKTLWPWQWVKDGIIYEDHIRAIEQFEAMMQELDDEHYDDRSLQSAIEQRRQQLLRAKHGR